MSLISNITFDQITLSFVAVVVIREAMIAYLPDDVAGPGGWLVDTGDN